MSIHSRSLLAVVIGVLLLSVASPARADGLSAGCTTTAGDGELRRLTAWAYYQPSGAYNQWYQFDYLLEGDHTGDQSNVNIWVYQNSSAVWSYHSPDSLDVNVWYSTPASVWTAEQTSEWTKFEAIFDRTWASDPRCVGRTQSV